MKKNILIFLCCILFSVYSDNVFSENKPPRIISSSFDVDENTTLIGSIEARDRDGDSIQFFSSKPNIISVGKNSGVLRFVKSPNYERKSSYTVKIIASDGINNKSKRISFNINNVNESPQITAKNFTWNLNDTKKLSLQSTDPENDRLTYSISGSDAKSFSVSNNGNVKLIANEGISKKTVFRDLELTISDGEYSDSKSIKITVFTDFLSLENTVGPDWSNQGTSFGNDIALTPNGKNLLIHAKDPSGSSGSAKGGIYVYNFQNRSWNKSFEIEGSDFYERLGANAMDISSNGKIFAYMYLTDSSDFEDVNNQDAAVRVYKYYNSLNTFKKMGSKISAYTKFPSHSAIGDYPMPYNLSLDETGKKLAFTDIESESGSVSCGFKIKTYEFSVNDWDQYGEDIDIGSTYCSYKNFHGVDLQNRGNKLVTSFYDIDLSSLYVAESIVLKAFSYNGSEWGQIGNTIYPNNIEDSIKDDLNSDVTSSWHQLIDFKLNQNGNKLAMLTKYDDGKRQSGLLRFYRYEEDQGDWFLDDYLFIEPCSEDISDIYPSLYQCSENSHSGSAYLEIQSFDISDDMKTIAFEIQDNWAFYSPRLDGMAVVYRKKGNKWKRYGSYICDNSNSQNNNGANCANSVEVSGDGNSVFIGAPNFQINDTDNNGAVLKLKLNNID
tara:strand:+ start:459 stop:2456 length:1998 start_codon:yes stop_codon:yes gene_type:complete